MPKFVASRSTVDQAIQRAQDFLLSTQAPDGHWRGELEADSTITSEYLLLCHLIDRVDRELEQKAVRYLRAGQLPDGGWPLYGAAPADLSATIKAYFALKLAGVSPEDPAMAAARSLIRRAGGPVAANVFTKITLALFGEYDWAGVPSMPVEIMLLPRWFYFNIYEVSYWSRTVIVPLLILMDKKPVKRLPSGLGLAELWPVPRERARLRLPRTRHPISWKNFFIAVEEVLKFRERRGTRPARARAVEAARLWLEERLGVPGGLGGIYPAMANAVLALRCLGYPDDHPLIRGQLKEIEALAVEGLDSLHYQPCVSPVWDTGLAANALVESGLPADHPALQKATEWLIDEQVLVPGDWRVKRPDAPPGGWPFQYGNDFYPDVDDSAMVMMALQKVETPDPERNRTAVERGLRWVLAMQGRDGGWGSFDADNNRLALDNIPFADHGGLIDASTEDLTGRAVELLGTLGYPPAYPPASRGIDFLRRTQLEDGSWYGRWGANHIYGTWSVLRGLRYLLDTQRPDGAWEDAFWNGTGFPRVFFLKYHFYAKYFPLWALGVYRHTQG